MDKRKSLLIFIIFTLLLYFNLVSCGGSDSTPDVPFKVFTTSASGNGNLGSWTDASGKTGTAAADAICQAAATSAGLPGTYKAWISDSTTDAYCHIQGYDGHTISDHCGRTTLPVAAGPWVRTDGTPFGATIDKIINNGVIYTPAAYDEKGNLLTTYNWYFTGTNYDGTKNSSQTCSDWTSSGSGLTDNAFFGQTAGTSEWWSGVSSATCNNTARLLCVQTGTGGPLPSITPPTSAKKVFVTSVTGTGDLISWTDYSGSATGAAAGDAICQARATAAGLANAANFKAWLSDSSSNAKDRITSDGPWYRLDGIKVADNKAALVATLSTSTPLFTGITYMETGAYVTAYTYRVWTGTKSDGTIATADCIDWGNSSSSSTALVGDAHTANYWWTSFTTLSCNQSAALYCFED